VVIATTSQPVRDSLHRCCAALSISTADTGELWLVDGHHTPALAIPEHTTILLLGPIPNGIIPTTTIPTPATLDAITEALSKHLNVSKRTLRNGWAFDAQKRTLSHDKEPPIALTEKEAALLQALLQVQPAEISRETLLTSIWAYDKEIDTHTVETHIYRLRQKVGTSPMDIVTTEQGYKVVL
jgi:hypothetical protein